jgi:hypothetical protein
MPEMMSFKFSENETQDFKKWVYKQKSENMAQCRALIVNTLQSTGRYAKMAAPVDKGFLRGKMRVNIGHEELGGSVEFGTNYAPYQEFGTGKYVFKNYSQYNRALEGLEDYASQFKGKGLRKVNIYPQPFLFPAFAIAVRNMMLKLKNMGFEPAK